MRGTVRTSTTALMALTAVLLAPTLASAHISVSGPGYANTTQEISFSVGHGCTDANGAPSDTSSVTIDIPVGVTSVRAMPNAFGKVTVTREDPAVPTSRVVSVTWTKAPGDVIKADDNFYKLVLRLKVPNAPFTTVYFPTHQTCTTGTGTVLPVVDWVGTVPNPSEDAGAAPEPAPALNVLPARAPGWNKVTVPVAVPADKLASWFADAQIVWKGSAAFSTNPATVEQIKATAGTTVLAALAAGDEIWVKY